jgi:hypothetical protein
MNDVTAFKRAAGAVTAALALGLVPLAGPASVSMAADQTASIQLAAAAGAFVYWNTSQYGHVGIADGAGGFYSSSVDGAIGHGDSLDYFVNCLGWSDPQVPQG